MMPVQTMSRPASGHHGQADAHVVSFPRPGRPGNQPYKSLRELREARGWSIYRTAQAMHASATPQERKSLPDVSHLMRNWTRWENGTEPDGHRSEPFFRPIIARTFDIAPERLFPSRRKAMQSQGQRLQPVQPQDLRAELESRRQFVQQTMTDFRAEIAHLEHTIAKLQAEQDYLDAMLAVPFPAPGIE